MCHDEVYIRKGCFRIGSRQKADLRIPLPNQDLACIRNDFLTLRIIVVKLDRAKRKAVKMAQQHQNDTRCIGASSTCNQY